MEKGHRSAARCFQGPGIIVVVLANEDEHDVDTTAGKLVDAARNVMRLSHPGDALVDRSRFPTRLW